jgi:hypothetical protein
MSKATRKPKKATYEKLWENPKYSISISIRDMSEKEAAVVTNPANSIKEAVAIGIQYLKSYARDNG